MSGAIFEAGGKTRVADDPLLTMRSVRVVTDRGATILDAIDFDVHANECVGVIGCSGAGKSTLLRVITGLLDPERFRVSADRLEFEGRRHGARRRGERRRILGRRIAVVGQEASSTLHPLLTIGDQIGQVIRRHRPECRARRRVERAVEEALDGVGLDARFARRHAHRMSGGECQRASIAMALVGRPSLVLADEPTAGLDVVAQRGVLERLHRATRAQGASLVFVSHDLRVLSDVADRIAVLDHGRIVEVARTSELLGAPTQAVTRELVESVPRLGAAKGPIRARRNRPHVGGVEVNP